MKLGKGAYRHWGFICFALLAGASVLRAEEVALSPLLAPLPGKAEEPADNPGTPRKIALGQKLFFDPRLSKSGNISCNSCHNVMGSGTDNLARSFGIGGKLG